MFNERKTIFYNINSPFSFENFHKLTPTTSREFYKKLSNTKCSQASVEQTNTRFNCGNMIRL